MMNLPKGYTIKDLFTILNRNAEDDLDGKLFTEGMFRLIFSDNFQHMIMLHQSLNEIKAEVRELHGRLTKQICSLSEQVTQQISEVRAPPREHVLPNELSHSPGS